VADDNKVNRLLLTRSLELQGHVVASAENGVVALQMLRAGAFDLMLLDMEMPELDGFGVLEQMAADGKLRDLPVIVTSSLEGVAHVVRCLDLGADDYLRKPVNPVLLKARINSSLEKKRLRDQQKALIARFATSEVAEDLQQSGFALGGRRLQCTVMFDAISGHGGVVNQMIGDGLMAIFGAPLPLPEPELAAVRAALDMQEMIEMFNHERVALEAEPIRIGIGIASGEVVAGYTGTQQRATYTCIGDTVNLAARLEAHTKVVGRGILVDAATQAAIGDRVGMKALGEVQFKGKAAGVGVFGVA
jgi:CheY-like chemotaxis protein